MPTDPNINRPAKSWLKIGVTVDSIMSDAVSAYLSELTGTGLEITNPAQEQESDNKAGDIEKITGYFAIDSTEAEPSVAQKEIGEIEKFLASLQQIFPECRVPILVVERVIEEDWGKKWKSFFTSFHVTQTLIIKPSWEETNESVKGEGKQPREKVIEMDPGLAFGTGHHASTQLALLLLEEIFQQSARQLEKILDVGTGSGILAMACGIFGAKEIVAIDNDPDAVETARKNIIRNHLGNKVSVSGRDINSLAGGFDLVVANITHDILAELAESLAGLVIPHGFLVLSGILQGSQYESLRQTYTATGLKFIKNLDRDDWTALEFRKE
jgi:ribosomal protein L11 methyltransferase